MWNLSRFENKVVWIIIILIVIWVGTATVHPLKDSTSCSELGPSFSLDDNSQNRGKLYFQQVVSNQEQDPPTADFDYKPKDPKIGEEIQFTDLSVEGNAQIVEWHWVFGNGANPLEHTTSNEQNPEHTYKSEGIYTVELMITDAENRTDTITKDIIVDIKGEIPDIAVFFMVLILGVVMAVAFTVLQRAFSEQRKERKEEDDSQVEGEKIVEKIYEK